MGILDRVGDSGELELVPGSLAGDKEAQGICAAP